MISIHKASFHFKTTDFFKELKEFIESINPKEIECEFSFKHSRKVSECKIKIKNITRGD